MRRVIRFVKALCKYIIYGKRVSFDEYVMRLGYCNDCTDINQDDWTCGRCGCFLDKKAKMSTEKCPKGIW